MTRNWRDYIGIVSLFIFILTLTITLTIFNVPLYRFTLSFLEIPERVGMSLEQIMHNYYELMGYLNNPFNNSLVLTDFPVSDSGAFHFYEVKILFFINYGALLLSGVVAVFYLRRLKKTRGYWKLVEPFRWAIIVPFILLLLLAINFDRMFVIFHEILFNNDAWLFNPATDPIIRVLPQEFFMYCFIFAFIVLELLLVAGYFISKNKAYKS
jgi:integral membrane protein (TIGR01906 family)